jgi:hypothetical protein
VLLNLAISWRGSRVGTVARDELHGAHERSPPESDGAGVGHDRDRAHVAPLRRALPTRSPLLRATRTLRRPQRRSEQRRSCPMEISHRDFLILPSAREDSLGRWMPVVTVRRPAKSPGAIDRRWAPQTIISESYRTREDAERRSVDIAKADDRPRRLPSEPGHAPRPTRIMLHPSARSGSRPNGYL